MQLHPFKAGDTVYQYNPYKKICEKCKVISIDDDAGVDYSKILISGDQEIRWYTQPELLSFEYYDFKTGGHTWDRPDNKYKDHGWFWDKEKTHFIFDKLLKQDKEMYMSSSDCIWRPFFSKDMPDFIKDVVGVKDDIQHKIDVEKIVKDTVNKQELSSIQVGTITAEQLIKRSEDLRDALGNQ